MRECIFFPLVVPSHLEIKGTVYIQPSWKSEASTEFILLIKLRFLADQGQMTEFSKIFPLISRFFTSKTSQRDLADSCQEGLMVKELSRVCFRAVWTPAVVGPAQTRLGMRCLRRKQMAQKMWVWGLGAATYLHAMTSLLDLSLHVLPCEMEAQYLTYFSHGLHICQILGGGGE